MTFEVQAAALGIAGVAAGLAGVGVKLAGWRARRRVVGEVGTLTRADGPSILYFTTDSCSVCRTHQEPALSSLEGVPVRKVDAVVEAALARRFGVLTVPTTVVLDADGTTRHVNYGFATASKLREQLNTA